MAVIDSWKIDLGDRVQNLPAGSQLGKVPTPVVRRAEQLCDVLDEAGEHREDRQFLVAAIVATTDPDPEDLAARLRRYRRIKVHETVLGESDEEGEIELPRPRSTQ